MPTSLYSVVASRIARATAAAFASPDGSPATIRISRTGRNRHRMAHRRHSALDLAHDLEGDCEGVAPCLAGHGHRCLAANSIDETLQLQRKRITLRRVNGLTHDELLERL